MIRLTSRFSDGKPFITNNTTQLLGEAMVREEILKRLATYEDLYERLPSICPGNTIYTIPTKTEYLLNIFGNTTSYNKLTEQIVLSVELFPDRCVIKTENGVYTAQNENITWFTNKDLAECKLQSYTALQKHYKEE